LRKTYPNNSVAYAVELMSIQLGHVIINSNVYGSVERTSDQPSKDYTSLPTQLLV